MGAEEVAGVSELGAVGGRAGDRGSRATLQDIDGQDWGEPDPEDSYLIRTCTALHRRPLAEFDDEALRIMIGQGIGLPTLIPMATEILQQRPLASGDMHPGALLATVLTAPPEFWAAHNQLRAQVVVVAGTVDAADPELAGTDVPRLLRAFLDAEQQ
jgi:hypothetical protein